MKKAIYLFILTIVFFALFSSCEDNKSYAEELKAEKALIADYIKRNEITVLSKFPKDSISFPDNAYVLTSSGLYFRLNKQGDGERDVVKNDEIVVRYYEYTLNESQEIYDYWNPQYYPEPYTFSYLNTSQASTAFHEAVGYMKRSGAEAELIVPSKIGFTAGSEVIPYGYRLKIQFRNNTIPENN